MWRHVTCVNLRWSKRGWNNVEWENKKENNGPAVPATVSGKAEFWRNHKHYSALRFFSLFLNSHSLTFSPHKTECGKRWVREACCLIKCILWIEGKEELKKKPNTTIIYTFVRSALRVLPHFPFLFFLFFFPFPFPPPLNLHYKTILLKYTPK